MPKGRNPVLSGVVQQEKEGQEREDIGKIALWLNESSHPRAPKYTGTIKTGESTVYRVVVWDRTIVTEKKVGDRTL